MRRFGCNSHRFLAARSEQTATRLLLLALAAPDAKRFSARYSQYIGVGSVITAFSLASTGD